MTAKHEMTGWLAAGLLAAALTASAQERDLTKDAAGTREKTEPLKAESQMAEARGGDLKVFRAVTDEDITAVEVGDIYKNNASFFKIVNVHRKGKNGGTFRVQRTSGINDPTRTWTRVSGLGPLTVSSHDTLWTLYLAGGAIMHPIALCMVVVIVIGVNGVFVFRRRIHFPPSFLEKARACLLRGDLDGFRTLASSERGLLGHICRVMTEDSEASGGCSPEAMRERCEMEANKQVNRLKIPLKTLNVVAAVAPMLGLLGTVIGMVQCFESLAFETASASKALTLAAGIRVALFTTVAGLLVAIPALIVMFLLNQKLNAIVSDCEITTSKFVNMIPNRGGATTPNKPGAPQA